MPVRAVSFLTLCLLALLSCAHPNRISRGALQKLIKERQSFVLVFGSVSTPAGVLAQPVIRFVHPANRPDREQLLWSLTISTGDRFFAILQPPPGASRLDEFYTEVGSAGTGFDKILYVRLPKDDAALAMYVGDIHMSPAQNRTTQGQAIQVNIHDDFQNAARELRRLYPRFEGTVSKAALLRNPAPAAAAPERVR